MSEDSGAADEGRRLTPKKTMPQDLYVRAFRQQSDDLFPSQGSMDSPVVPLAMRKQVPLGSPQPQFVTPPPGSPAASFRSNATVRSLPSAFHAGRPGPVTGGMGGFILSIIAANTMNGPGLLAIPSVFRGGGWLLSTVGLTLAAVLTGDTASLLSSSITISIMDRDRAGSIQTNLTGISREEYGTSGLESLGRPDSGFMEEEEEAEFGPLAKRYLGDTGEVITQALLAVSLVMLTCAQIVVTSQALDAAFVFFFGDAVALKYMPSVEVLWSGDSSLTPFGSGQFAVSVGFLFDMAVCVTLGFFDLSQNMLPQYLSSAATAFSLCVFTWQLLLCPPLDTAAPPLPTVGPDASSIVGVSVFNFAYIIAVPSLQAESSPKADFKGSMWAAVLVMLTVYLYMGFLGGTATHPDDRSANVLNLFMVPGAPHVTKIAVFAYATALVLPIPVYVILLRRTLEQGRVTEPGLQSIIVSNMVPWLLALMCYMQPWFGAIVNWSSLLCLGFINYSIPLAISFCIRREHLMLTLHQEVTIWETMQRDRLALKTGVYFVLLTFVAVPAAVSLSLAAAG
eukprot:TRINITY_DN10544_c0_g1_i2.p1 TRINITY_DN10544_c0_g1~~TRINITY_DN10544_c0_g1_i2.p1  ORF type:complete len:566 (+),score=94.76 TRINITY_DN10544_c0_g1_i2:85-1782(+)